MTDRDQVATDALLDVGIDVSVWRLRCVHAFLRVMEAHGRPRWTEYNTPSANAETRLKSDLFATSLDQLQSEAQWLHAEWMAGRQQPVRILSSTALPLQEALL